MSFKVFKKYIFFLKVVLLWLLVYTKRSQHAAIENSHANEKRVGLALLKPYCKVLALPSTRVSS